MGRPTDFTPEIADAICQRIAEGQSVRTICKDDAMPGSSTVFRWLSDPAHAAFREQYARAREAAVEAYAEEILEISEQAEKYIDKEGNSRIDQGDVQLRKLRADNLKWIMSKLAPKKYGDKLELGGSVGIRHEDALAQLDDDGAGAPDQASAS